MKFIASYFQPNCENYIKSITSILKNSVIYLNKNRYLNKEETTLKKINFKIQNKKFILLSGSSSSNSFEKKLRKVFYKNNLPVYIFLDSLFNLRKRFTKLDLEKAFIFVNDDFSKRELLKIKFSKKNVFNYGNSFLDYLISKEKKKIQYKSKKILFLSQPLSERQFRLNEFFYIKILSKIIKKYNYKIDIKIHPREKKNKWSNFKNRKNFNLITSELNKLNLDKYKFIFGISSESFLECIVKNQNVYALNFNKKNYNNYCIRNNFVNILKNQIEIEKVFHTKLVKNSKLKINKNYKKKKVRIKIKNKILNESKKFF